jgi:hypothetical protein
LFLPQCDRPSFTPIQNNPQAGKNWTNVDFGMNNDLSLNENMPKGKYISSRIHPSHRASYCALSYVPAYLSIIIHMGSLNLFTHGIFNCAVNISDNTPWIENNELDGSEVSCRHLPGGTEKNHDKLQTDNRYENCTSWIRSDSAAHCMPTFGTVQRRKRWAVETTKRQLLTASTTSLILILIFHIYKTPYFNQLRSSSGHPVAQKVEKWQLHENVCEGESDLSILQCI